MGRPTIAGSVGRCTRFNRSLTTDKPKCRDVQNRRHRRLSVGAAGNVRVNDLSKKLSSADVAKLLADPSDETRADTARKVSEQYRETDLRDSERKIIEDIFHIMVKDAAVRVREALSQSVKDNPDIPRDIARSLANDVAEVALPILEFSDVLTEEDLVSIIAEKGTDHQKAIARRSTVTEKVSDALVGTKNEDVVATLVSNDGAQLSEKTLNRVVDTYGRNKRISDPMAMRQKLPLTVAERLVNLVSEKIRDHLVIHHDMSPDVAMDLFLSAREKATIGLLQPGTNLRDVVELVDQLHRNNRLTPTLIMRAICMGDTTFFEAALARKADIPIANAYRLIYDPGKRGLEALFEKCGMSKKMLRICRAALELAADMRLNSGDDRDRFRQVMIERVLTRFEEGFDPDNLDYFIAKLGRTAKAA